MSENLNQIKGQINEKITESFLIEQSRNIDIADSKKVLVGADEIILKIKDSGVMRKYLPNLRLMIQLVKDVNNQAYTADAQALQVIVYSILYIYTPEDLIPDFVPGTGFLDDEAVVARCISLCSNELLKYRDFKTGTGQGSFKA